MGRGTVGTDAMDNNIDCVSAGKGRTFLHIHESCGQSGRDMKGQGVVWGTKALPEIVFHHYSGTH